MNISLEKTEEFVNGRLRRSYGEAFIRGNNGKEYDLASVHCFLLFCSYVHFRCLKKKARNPDIAAGFLYWSVLVWRYTEHIKLHQQRSDSAWLILLASTL